MSTDDRRDDARCPRCGSVTTVFDLGAASSITCPQCDPAYRAHRDASREAARDVKRRRRSR